MSCENKVYSILGFKMRLNWLEAHHGYLGIILMLSSFILTLPLFWSILIFTIGIYLLIDDIYQHHRQVIEFDPCYHSPVHRFIYDYLKLYDRAWFRALNKLADWLFGNPIILAIIVCLIVIWRLW